MSTPINDTVVNSYVETLIWSESVQETLTYEGDVYEEGSSLEDLVDSSDLEGGPIWDEALADLEGFRTSCLQELGIDPFVYFDGADVAYNFALSRNGHGAGFFDSVWEVTASGYCTVRGQARRTTDLSKKLQACAKQSGTHGLTVWVDESGELKVEGHS